MKLYIVRGPAGSGKSTYCQEVLLPKIRKEFGVNIENRENDKFFTDANGKYNWNPNKLWLAIKHCQTWVKRDLENFGVAVVSNVFSTILSMKPYFEIAEKLGAEVKVIRMCNLYGSVHGVPKETIERMRATMQDCQGEELIKN